MAERNVIQQEFDTFGKGAGMLKKSGTWYRTSDDVIQAMNLQKSQYGPSYYINIGWWLRSLGDAKFPTDNQWHIGTRLESLTTDRDSDIKLLLDLNSGIADDERGQRLRDLLTGELLPVLDQSTSLEGLRLLRRKGGLKGAAIRGPALAILDQSLTPGG